jgi:hypothetical protein
MQPPHVQNQPFAGEACPNPLEGPLVQSGKLWPSRVAEPGALGMILVGVVGLSFLVVEGVLLSSYGVNEVPYGLIAVFVASTVSSIAGFAFSALCGALLFHLIKSPVYAVNVMIVCSIAIQMLSVTALWRAIDWKSLGVFLVGGFLGVPAGVWLLLHLPASTYRGVIGGMLMAYGTYLLLRRPMRALQCGRVTDSCAGFLGGITGGLAGFPGAFVTIWCGLKGWEKTRQRGVYQPFILAMQPVTLLAIYLMQPSGPARAQTALDWKVFAFVPAALLGAWFGLRIFKRLSDRQFEIVVNVLLVVSGVGLLL